MNIKCGTDIIEISRIKQSIDNFGETFINKILSSVTADLSVTLFCGGTL